MDHETYGPRADPAIDEIARFSLDRSVISLYQIGHDAGKASIVLVTLLAAVSVLTFASNGPQEVSVPMLSLSLPRLQASEALLLIAGCVYYKCLTLQAYERILEAKVERLYAALGGVSQPWYIRHPSLFNIP